MMGISRRVLGVFVGMTFLVACSPQSSQSVKTTGLLSAIIGGTPVTDQDPIGNSTVQLLHVKVKKVSADQVMIQSLSLCSGTIVAADLILTAGHCSSANPKELILLFSNQVPDFKTFFQTIAQNAQVRRVVAGVTAPNWQNLTSDTATDWGDLSLLRFTGGLPSGYVPAQLLGKDEVLAANEAITLAGFGETDGVNKTAATQLLKASVQIADPSFSATEMEIASINGKGACHGDSGGPAYIELNGQNYLAGVTSRADVQSDPKAVCVGKSIYTKVQSYLSWISSEAQKLESDTNYGLVISEPVVK